MNKTFVPGFILLALLIIIVAASVSKLGSSPTGEVIQSVRVGQLRQVTITNSGYEPEVLFARRGDRIRFTNLANTSETATSETFGSPLLFPGDIYEVIITSKNGTIEYFSLSNSGFEGEIRILN